MPYVNLFASTVNNAVYAEHKTQHNIDSGIYFANKTRITWCTMEQIVPIIFFCRQFYAWLARRIGMQYICA